jgi:hypothetical protein
VLTVVHDEAEPNATSVAALGSSLLDEIVRDGARQMLAAALPRWSPTSRRIEGSWTRTVTGWWSATATRLSGR